MPATGAHPRSRGENAQAWNSDCARRGASPLTRGKPIVRYIQCGRRGRIPAHAGKTRNGVSPASQGWAHPRSRGENAFHPAIGHTQTGASPLTRGKRADELRPVDLVRRIPAHAGKTRTSPSRTCAGGAHPRSRGENTPAARLPATSTGTSPLTRGKPEREQAETSSARRIPAHAGKTMQWWCQYGDLGAHPRSRGENRSAPNRAESRGGASPLTRGKPQGITTRAAPFGRIPAHAGKTKEGKVAVLALGAHPRSRGENASRVSTRSFARGASPLTRGKRPAVTSPSRPIGRIPAHAGKTMQWWCQYGDLGAHPRSRGENRSAPNRAESRGGASPLTRGKPQGITTRAAPFGRIPAHAGKTKEGKVAVLALGAHPRSRGENASRVSTRSFARGASPLTRGKRPAVTSPSRPIGRIPAHAGKTARPCSR